MITKADEQIAVGIDKEAGICEGVVWRQRGEQDLEAAARRGLDRGGVAAA
ncbi:MAG: hypothetical protein WBI00_04490 [Thermoanaerobaculia bacterium]